MPKTTIIYDGEINPENIAHFISQMDEVLATENDIDVYFSSSGGHVHYSRLLIDYFQQLNNLLSVEIHGDVDTGEVYAEKKERTINLKGFQVVASAAFEFFVKAENCTKEVLPDTVGMIHAYTTSYDYREDIMRKDSVLSMKMLEEMNAKLEDFLYTCGVTKTKIKGVMDGRTVVLSDIELKKCADEWSKREESV